MTSGRACGTRTTFVTGAWVPACEINTCSIVRAFTISEALPTLAARQSVTDVASRTRAHWPLLPGIVMARRANCINTAGIRFAEVARFEQSAADEGITGHMFRATANGIDTA